MNPFRALKTLALLACLAWAGGWSRAGAAVINDVDDPYDTEDMEVMTRGPVHEAFGTPQSFNPEPGIVAPVAPPQPFEESPPEEMPDDPNAVWVPGYWMWDDDLGDFLWVSGIVRIAPEGLVWVDGYWADTDDGSQRVSGFWQPVETPEVQYAPSPPESLEAGPAYDPPTPEAIWSPGYWDYAPQRWHWTDGSWIRPVPDWIWVPPHWIWTPRGYVRVPGYWDCIPERRAIVFAPIHFRRPIYEQPQYVYTPLVTIRIEAIFINLFSRPRCNQYYFGDYFDPDCHRRGYYPWFECENSRRWHDPIFSYACWRRRSEGPVWLDLERRRYDSCRDNRDRRPPHTFRDQLDFFRGGGDSHHSEFFLGQPLRDFRNNRISNKTIINNETTVINFSRDPERRNLMNDQSKETRKFRDERRQWEGGDGNGRQGRSPKDFAAPLSLRTLTDAFPDRERGSGGNDGGNRGGGNRSNSTGRSILKSGPPAEPEVLQDAGSPDGAPKGSRGRSRQTDGRNTIGKQEPTPTPSVGRDGNRGRGGRENNEGRDGIGNQTPTPTPSAGGDGNRGHSGRNDNRDRNERSLIPNGDSPRSGRIPSTPDVTPTPKVQRPEYSPKKTGGNSFNSGPKSSDSNPEARRLRITPTPRPLWTPKPIVDYKGKVNEEHQNPNRRISPMPTPKLLDNRERFVKPDPTPRPTPRSTPRPTPRNIDQVKKDTGGNWQSQGVARNTSRQPVVVNTPVPNPSQTSPTVNQTTGDTSNSNERRSKKRPR